MTQRVYFEEEGPIWEWWGNPTVALPEDRYRVEVRHGYTLRSLDHLARRALIRCHGSGLAMPDRYMIAYEAITIALMETDETPDEYDLVRAAQMAITSANNSEFQAHGLTHTEAKPSPRFMAYWRTTAGPTQPAVERVEDRIALTQIWAHLTENQREALLAFASTGQRAKAAKALGLQEPEANRRILVARRAAVALWHDHETPAPLPKDRRRGSNKKPPITHCRRGHEYTLENTITRWDRSVRRVVRRCRACRDAANARLTERRRNEREAAKQKVTT